MRAWSSVIRSRVLSGDLGCSRVLSGGVEMRAFSSSIFWRSVSEEVSSAGRVPGVDWSMVNKPMELSDEAHGAPAVCAPETAVSSSEREAKLACSACAVRARSTTGR